MATTKKTTKTAKKAAPKAPRTSSLPEKNGVRRPKDGTKTGTVWAIADKLKEKHGRTPVRSEVQAEAEKKDINPATVSTQFQCWRVFHGIEGRGVAAKRAPKKSTKAAPKAPKAKAPKAPKAPSAPEAAAG